MTSRKIRVLVVDDSTVVRELLRAIIDSHPALEMAAGVATGEEALRVLNKVSPDVISMDIRLPGMNGFEATQRIMTERPTPIVVVSASIESEELNITMNALRAGALTVVEKPVGTTHHDYQRMADHLCTQLIIMSEVKLIRQRAPRTLSIRKLRSPPESLPVERGERVPFQMVGMVASTGGPSALVNILGTFDATFPLPILLVQHIVGTFLDGFVVWLRGQCRLRVELAGDGVTPAAGTIYVAPADVHLRVEERRLRLRQTEPVDGQRPSGTVLFESMAASLGAHALGVLLTGMGMDGARGMLAVRQAGGYTIAEDASTAVVYGMPGEAVNLGAVCESLPLGDIAPRLAALIGGAAP